MRTKFALLCLLLTVLLVACGGETPAGPSQPGPQPTSTSLPPEPTAPPSPTALSLSPTPAPTVEGEAETLPNGRLLERDVLPADLDGDGTAEQIVLSNWMEAGEDEPFPVTLEVAILDAEGEMLYQQRTWDDWEDMDDPSTAPADGMSLFAYNLIESVAVQDLTGDGRPEVTIQKRYAGTGHLLEVTILHMAEGEIVPRFEGQFYKGGLMLTLDGFEASQPLYLYGEANCCPCRFETLRYRWDGERFVGTERVREGVDPESEVCPAFPRAARWERVEVADGPPPRRDAAMVYDSARSRVILFGGRAGSLSLSDTWAFDLNERRWQQLATDGASPPARFSMVAGIDAPNERLLIATGQTDDGSVFDDVWALDLTTDQWQEVAVAGERPAARYGAGGGIFSYSDALYLSHGFADTRYDDTWAFDLESNQWRNVTPAGTLPLKRCLHGAVMSSPDSMFLYGGCASGFGPCPLGDSWALDGTLDRWLEVSSEGPSARLFPAMTLMDDRSAVLLFGGEGEGAQDQNDLWRFDLVTQQWQEISAEGEAPTARDGHSMVWAYNFAEPESEMAGNYAVIFGGASGREALNDLWLFYPGDE